MANFTSEIKKEIISCGIRGENGRKSALSAFFRTSGELHYDFFTKKYGFEFTTESEEVAEFFFGMMEETYSVTPTLTVVSDRLSGREKIKIEFDGANAEDILADIKILNKRNESYELVMDISDELAIGEDERTAFVKGAFLGGGSCTLPSSEKAKTGYHLQFVFPSRKIANDFSNILCSFDVLSKCIEHKGAYVVYVNSKETISDFLSFIGAENCLSKLGEIVDIRDIANNVNRTQNCVSGNKQRTEKAAAAQYEAILFIKERVGLSALPPSLQKLARLRLSDRQATLRDMAEKLNLSKSCVNHRMKKLLEIYDSLEK